MEEVNILVCEDEALIARSIEMSLTNAGYKVVGIAADGESAIRLAERHRPELALMDIHLKGQQSGIEVAQVLADEFGIPSIYLTAYADEETVENAKATRPIGYLLKPVRDEELRSTVETAIFHHRESQRVMAAMQANIEELTQIDAVHEAVRLERQFMNLERQNSNFRVVEHVVRQLREDLIPSLETVEKVSNSPEVQDEHRSSLKGALIHQDRNLNTIDRLLKCSEPPKMRLEEAAIQDLIREVTDSHFGVGTKRLKLVDLLPADPRCVLCDRESLSRVIVNILSNAEQAMPTGGTVKISFSEQHEDLPERFNEDAAPGDYLSICFADDGPGIDKKVIERVFEPGFTASGVPFSAGLGLSEAYMVLQRHSGWLSVESEEGSGTSVFVTLPLVESPKQDEIPTMNWYTAAFNKA